ncbi:hypothetical protein OAL43_02770 [bacterium]|nr:hypothetical protein [bacterium]
MKLISSIEYNLTMNPTAQTDRGAPTSSREGEGGLDRNGVAGRSESAGFARASRWRFRISLRECIGLVSIAALGIALVSLSYRLADRESELAKMRQEYGYLAESKVGQIAAARSPSEQPLTYRLRIRVPAKEDGFVSGYRIAYSSLWEAGKTEPTWYAALPVPAGESLVTIKIHEDPRDDRWKISAVVSSSAGTKRMATVLPATHEEVFRASHDVISTGIGRQTAIAESGGSLRLLDDRWLLDGAPLVIDGVQAPRENQIGVYVELLPVEPVLTGVQMEG